MEVEFDYRFLHPFTSILAGPTGCGKTVFCIKLIEHAENVIYPPPERIYWFYSQWQDAYSDERLKNVIFQEGLPSTWPMEDEARCRPRTLLILDDLMSSVTGKVTQLWTQGSHHWNTSCLLITQNLFYNCKEFRNLNLNSHYTILFKCPRDVGQLMYLARQAFPGKGEYVKDAYRDCTSKRYGYIIWDFRGSTPDEYRLRSDIFGEGPGLCTVYLPK